MIDVVGASVVTGTKVGDLECMIDGIKEDFCLVDGAEDDFLDRC